MSDPSLVSGDVYTSLPDSDNTSEGLENNNCESGS
jgi:hypothetical protein